jgi:protein gp37
VSENTKIEWCDHSWSPWRGCTKVSAGCANCYAETLSKRNPAVLGQWGKGKPRVLAKNWNDPVKWNRREIPSCMCDVKPPERCGCYSAPTVFPSLCDWLDDEVPIEWLARFLKLIHDTPNLNWLLLSKRPENWRNRLANAALEAERLGVDPFVDNWLYHDLPPKNVWIGTSVEDQPNADRRIPAPRPERRRRCDGR